MFAKFKIALFMLAIVAASTFTTSRSVKAENVLNGQHTENVQLVLDDSQSHEVFVQINDTSVLFYVDGVVPLVSVYNNGMPHVHVEILGGPHGDQVVFNDFSGAYLAGVDVQLEFVGGDGNDSVEHGINMWTGTPDPPRVSDFPCTFFGNGGVDNLEGANGDDLIFGNAGVGLLSGGPGNDVLVGDDSMDSIHGGEGNDTILGGNGWNFLYGGDGNDSLTGGLSWDTIHGDDGNDTIKGGLGNDNLHGGDDNDSIFGGPGADDIYGGPGDDFIKGESGLDEIFGGEGNDVLDGAGTQNMSWGFGLWYPTQHDSSADVIEGGPGEDWFKNYMHLKPAGDGSADIADQDTLVDYDPGEGDIATQAIWQMTYLPILGLGR